MSTIPVEEVASELQRGGLVIAPVEHSYVLLCDAFNQVAVKRLHELRGDAPGIAAQVIIGDVRTLSGIVQGVTEEMMALATKFWPGLLTLNLQPNSTLNWDLGDAGALGEIAVRIPRQEYLNQLLIKSGPLAMASANKVGKGTALFLDPRSEIYQGADLIIDIGELSAGPLSTVVRASIIGRPSPLEISRVGAITLDEIVAIVPEIQVATA
jgi:tRNA threonylcarbamoyl adenosine modification protein (Sua5/YciO/YrdC/YwlC family)